jgi:sulfonate transport system substrate-binding protein
MIRRFLAGGFFLAFLASAVLIYSNPWKTTPHQNIPTLTTEQSKSIVTVRLNAPFPAIDFAPFYVAKKMGWIEESLGKIRAKADFQAPLLSVPASTESLAADRVDMLMTADTVGVIARSSGIDVQIVWLSCTLMEELIVPINSPVKTLADLRGKKVALITGSGGHYWLLRHMEALNMQRSDVTILNLFPPDAKAAFKQGSVDAWAIFPPFSEQEIAEGTARVLPGLKSPAQVVMVARGRFCSEHAEAASSVVQALERAKRWLIENPAQAQEIVAEEINMPLHIVQSSWSKMVWEADLDDAVISDIQSKADFFVQEKIIRNPVNVESELIRPLTK